MSLLKQLLDDKQVYLYVDFRSGSLKDHSGNQTAVNDGGVLKNKKAMFGFITTCAYGVIPIGTNDFSILVKQKPYQYNALAVFSNTTGGYSTFNVANYSSGGLSLYMDSTYYNISGTGAEIGKDNRMGWTCDRDGNVRVFYNGLFVGLRDISAKSAYNLQINAEINYKTSTRRSDYDYVLIVKRVLTDTEMAQLTAELENKKWTSKTKSSTHPYSSIINGKLYNDNNWTLGTDGTSGNNWTIGSGKLVYTSLATTGVPVTVFCSTLNLTAGKIYYLNFDLTLLDTSCRFGIFEKSGGITIVDYDTYNNGGRVSLPFTSSGLDQIRIIASQVSKSFEISNLTLTEVPEVIYKTENGIHAEQKTYSTVGDKIANTDLIVGDGSFKITDDAYDSIPLNDTNLFTDGDMEAVDTSAWTAVDATLSKEVSDLAGSTQCLKLTSTAATFYAGQSGFTENKYYIVRGYYKTDGFARGTVYADSAYNLDSPTTWTYFEKTVLGRPTIYIGSTSFSGVVYFDNVEVLLAEPNIKCLDYTHVASGKYVYLPTSALGETPSEAAYGTWEFVFKKGSGTTTLRAGIINSEAVIPNSGTNNGYYIYVAASSNVKLVRVDSGTSITLFTISPITDTEYHEIKLTRDETGLFELFVDNVSKGTINDDTHTTSNYMVFNPEGASSKIILSSEKGTYGIIKK